MWEPELNVQVLPWIQTFQKDVTKADFFYASDETAIWLYPEVQSNEE